MELTNIIMTQELKKRTAGGDSYIRTKDCMVKGLAITKQKKSESSKNNNC